MSRRCCEPWQSIGYIGVSRANGVGLSLLRSVNVPDGSAERPRCVVRLHFHRLRTNDNENRDGDRDRSVHSVT